jgi:hypothetical protein
VSSLSRLTLCAVAVCGLLVGLASLAPHTAAWLGLDFWSFPTLQEQVRHGEECQATLNEHDRQVQERLALRHRLIGNLLDNRATLAQTVARFGELNAEEPGLSGHVREVFPGRTEQESTYRQVLAFTQAAVASERPEAEPTLARLRGEFQQLLQEQADD